MLLGIKAIITRNERGKYLLESYLESLIQLICRGITHVQSSVIGRLGLRTERDYGPTVRQALPEEKSIDKRKSYLYNQSYGNCRANNMAVWEGTTW